MSCFCRCLPIAHGIYFSVKGIRTYMRSIVSARQINPVSKSGFPVMARAIDCIGANKQLFSKQDSRESIAKNMVNALIKARIEISIGKYWNPMNRAKHVGARRYFREDLERNRAICSPKRFPAIK